MIVVKLQGGLGNQLFQYATARALARHHRTSVALDLSLLRGTPAQAAITARDYELAVFGIAPTPPPLLDCIAYGIKRPPIQKKRLQKLARRILSGTEYHEKSFRFDPDIAKKTSAHTYLVGYFQSESYFKSIRTELRAELTFIQPPREDLAAQIRSTLSVSLHIRRGDYATNPVTQKFHGLCSLDYYYRAVGYLAEKLGSMHIFVFSDDTTWARENLHLSHPVTFVEGHTGADSYRDMQLMSLCRHHIVANSSFSWWGAWLNPSPGKVVIAPRRWFADPIADSQSQDIVPPEWIRL